MSGVKNPDYHSCTTCVNYNAVFLIPFLEDGCTGAVVVDPVCNGPAWVILSLSTDPNNPCRRKWTVRLDALATADFLAIFIKEGIENCYDVVTLELESWASDTCQQNNPVVTVTPFGDWDLIELNTMSCLPAYPCQRTIDQAAKVLESLPTGFDAACCSPRMTCCCSSKAMPVPVPTASRSCSCSQNVNVENGNLNLSFAMPAADAMAPREQLTYNSSPLFGANSPFADSIMQSPPGGAHVAGILSMRLIAPTSESANVIRCDGSVDLYRCKNASHGYVPIQTINELTELVDGGGATTGWTEVTKPNEMTYKYNSSGYLLSIENPVGQRWTMVRWRHAEQHRGPVVAPHDVFVCVRQSHSGEGHR